MDPYIQCISAQFEAQADRDKAKSAARYLHDQFKFYGVQTPLRRKICMFFFKSNPIDSYSDLERVIKQAYASDHREMHYFAIELLSFHAALWRKETIGLIEWMITENSWWDSVDALNSFVISKYFKIFPEMKGKETHKWNRSSNIWLQRSSIIFQLLYKEQTDLVLLEDYIQYLKGSKEFFIQKGIGWALRQYARTNADWVRNFVKANPELSALSKREALKHIEK